MSEKKPVYLTKVGLEELKVELDELINVKRPANIIAIKEARALGDLSENADYDAARDEQAQIEGRIQKLEKMIENAVIIEETSKEPTQQKENKLDSLKAALEQKQKENNNNINKLENLKKSLEEKRINVNDKQDELKNKLASIKNNNSNKVNDLKEKLDNLKNQ